MRLWDHATGTFRSRQALRRSGETYHLLGRIVHLLEDMTSPAHCHADPHPTGDDFEGWGYEASADSGHFFEYTFPGLLPKFPADRTIAGFMDEVAMMTYELSSFYGELVEVTGAQPTSELVRMFPSLHYYDGGLLGDRYWEIDDVGRFEGRGHDDWWACEGDHVEERGGLSRTRRITGNFYIENAGGDSGALTPAAFEKPGYYEADPNDKDLLRIYGDVLYSESVAYGAALLEVMADAMTHGVDLLLVIDETASMRDDLEAVKSAALRIARQVLASPDVRVALVTYRSLVPRSDGWMRKDAYRDVVAFTSDASELIRGIDRIEAGEDAGWRKSVYSALMHCMPPASLGGWRKGPVEKVIILLGDAPPQDPEPVTGLTLSDVLQAAVQSSPSVVILPVAVGRNVATHAYFSGLAEGTGGEVFEAASRDHVVSALMSAIDAVISTPRRDTRGW